MSRSFHFKKLGRIIKADPNVEWMSSFAGPSFARRRGESSIYDIYVTGRDSQNRSSIGLVSLDLKNPHQILSISPQAIFSLGELAAFDENGVSYPSLVQFKNTCYMSYVGWMPTTMSRFQNHAGMAYETKPHSFHRLSKAPILERTDLEYSGTGSACMMAEGELLKMWYTSFIRWERCPDESIKHYYVIRYAESTDAKHWTRSEHICINFQNDTEFAISRPSVLKLGDTYHMWFAYRGAEYRIGYASSKDAINWQRDDSLAGISTSTEGWDSKAVCYPHVFQHDDDIYMIYNGNHYGKEGLGLAILEQDR